MTRIARRCWIMILVSLLAFACGDDSERPVLSDWQPSGMFDCHAELSAQEVALMSPVDLTIRVRCGGQAELPLVKQIPPGFTGEAESGVVADQGGWLHTVVFHLRPTTLGEIVIEPFKVEQDGETITTVELRLKVVSTLGEGVDKVAIEGQAALQPTFAWWPYLVAGLALLVLVAALIWWSRHPKVEPAHQVEVPVPAHVKALRALQGLKQPATEVEIERFYVEVSRILRVYLEERFGLHAPTRSTEEFLIELEGGDSFSLVHKQSLRNFLQQCDLVKFAKAHPGIDVHEETLRVASTVVAETRADLVQGGVA